jgi:SAM-dependent methyltransferase
LIVTDLSDAHFASLRKELEGIDIRFICTDVRQLNGIEENSIDYLVCNYTLCAVEAEAGGALQALGRFHEVLKPGGELFIEEEFPIDAANSPAQMVWAEKWRILKAALLIVGELPFHEFTPEVLVDSCNTAGFSKIEWEKNTNLLPGQDALDFFHVRLERLMGRFPNQALRMGFREWADALDERAKVAGGMEIPFYRLHAYKENG